MADVKAVGIDLGTTNSAVAWLDDSGRTAMLRSTEGDILTPSVVFFDDAEIIVGKEALRAAATCPDRVAQWVKRDMGQPVYSRPIRGQHLPPEVIQSCILRKLRADVVATLGAAAKAVITVPAYFDEPRRKATADAGEMAGLSLLDIVNEPTAAALAFGEVLGYLAPGGKLREEMVVMVYDLGGGTFDATLLRLAPGDICTLATDGDVQLGGHDWDARLVAYAAESFKKVQGCDPRDDAGAMNRLYNEVVEAKHALSVRARTLIRVEFAGRSVEVPIGRDQFEEMTADLLERTAYTSRQMLAAANLQWKDVSRILLVGGSTRMPMVARKLQELTGILPDRTVNPDEAVARGAAIYAKYLLCSPEQGGTGAAFQVTNVNSHSLGIEGIDPQTMRKINVVLIPRNTALPVTLAKQFVTKTEGQQSIAVQVLEGESSLPGDCTAIGRTVIRNLPQSLPKNWPIEVTFQYGTNGRLAVRAVVPGADREVTLELERDVGLSNEGISRWKQIVGSAAGFGQFDQVLEEVLGMPAVAQSPPAIQPAASTGDDDRWDPGPPPAAAVPASQDIPAPPSLRASIAPRAASAGSGPSAASGEEAGRGRGSLDETVAMIVSSPPAAQAGAAFAAPIQSQPTPLFSQPSAVEVQAMPARAEPRRPEPMATIPRAERSRSNISRRVFNFIGFAASIPAGLGLGYLLWKLLLPHPRANQKSNGGNEDRENEPPRETAQK